MMTTFFRAFFAGAAISLLGTGLSIAAEHGSMEDARALLDKAIAHANSVGGDKAFADFSRPDGGFVDRDLYVYCSDMQGNLVAHGANPSLIGKNLMDIADSDGTKPIKEQIRIIEANGQGSLDYRWPNPVTKKIEAKSSFFRKLNDGRWCGVGYYKS